MVDVDRNNCTILENGNNLIQIRLTHGKIFVLVYMYSFKTKYDIHRNNDITP